MVSYIYIFVEKMNKIWCVVEFVLQCFQIILNHIIWIYQTTFYNE